MKLSTKMMIRFSVITFITILVLSSYTIRNSIEGGSLFTSLRFANMSTSISRDLEQTIRMMSMTVKELSQNISFTASLNQFIRDDSPDWKVGKAAKKAALQSLYQSPLVDQYYRVSFISLDGMYLTNVTDKDYSYTADPEKLLEIASILGSSPENADPDSYQILPPAPDIFSFHQTPMVYGIIQPVQYYGKTIGYLAVLDEYSRLDHIMDFVDNTEEVEVQVVFDNGTLLYSSKNARPYPMDLSTGEMQLWSNPENGATMDVLHTKIDSLGLHLYIARDHRMTSVGENSLRLGIWKRALLIMTAALVVIASFSLGLTRSIRLLIKKIRHMSPKNMLSASASDLSFTDTVTSAKDKEIHALEQAYNDMMMQLRKSTLNELSLREATLQAQLNALQTQINPHFIYNTLNIISAKSMDSGNFEIIEICNQFASMLRYSTDTHSRTATMEEEIENVRNYLLLAKARYEDNLEFTIDVPSNLHKIQLPKLTLQPLVENALTHGYDGKNIQRRLSILGTIKNNTLSLQIRDNGIGFSPEMLENLQKNISDINAGKTSIEKSSGHIGLINTCLRLHYYSSGAIHVSIQNDNGAVITLTMALSKDSSLSVSEN